MSTLFIHCGIHKTGSTTIQNGLEGIHDLLRQNGLHIPLISNSTENISSIHSKFSKSTTKPPRKGRKQFTVWDRMFEGAKGCEDVLISSEEFSTAFLKHRRIDNFRKHVAPYGMSLHFIYFLRDYPSWLNSIYIQECKRFATDLSFADYAERAKANPRYHYEKMILATSSIEYAKKTILPFEHASHKGLLRSVLEVTNIPKEVSDRIEDPVSANLNAGQKTVYVGRKLAKKISASGLSDRKNRLELAGKFKKMYSKKNWGRSPFYGLTPEISRDLQDYFRDSHDRIAKEYMGGEWTSVVGEQPIKKRSEFHITPFNIILNLDVIQVQAKMLKEVRIKKCPSPKLHHKRK